MDDGANGDGTVPFAAALRVSETDRGINAEAEAVEAAGAGVLTVQFLALQRQIMNEVRGKAPGRRWTE